MLKGTVKSGYDREAGFPRVGRDAADPVAREKIKELVEKWIKT